jgi:sugar fermentation stimulation protein A
VRFGQALTKARLIKRYKRFLADVEMADGSLATVHVANPGAMTGLAEPGAEVWLSRSPNAKRKLPWSWELVWVEGGLVGVNTMHPNAVAFEAIAAGAIPELAGYSDIRREVRYGAKSRIDLLLAGPDRPTCYVEVKNVNLKRGDAACFPDSVTARGTRHLGDLAERVRLGDRAAMLFLVQRGDCGVFRPADWIDPAYSAALRRARAEGVETLCYACRLSLDGIEIGRALPLELGKQVWNEKNPA